MGPERYRIWRRRFLVNSSGQLCVAPWSRGTATFSDRWHAEAWLSKQAKFGSYIVLAESEAAPGPWKAAETDQGGE